MGGGGAERQLSYLAHEFNQNGIDTHIAYIYEGENSARIVESGAQTHLLHCANNYDPRLFVQISSLIRNIKPNIVQTWLPQMDILAGIGALTKNVPYILSERSSAPCYPGTLKDRLRISIGRKASYIVANSQSGGEYWSSHKKRVDTIKIIRNAIPFEEIVGTPPMALRSLGVAEDAEVILYAGRYSKEKNLSRFVVALEKVFGTRPNAVGLFFGDGPLRDQLLEIQNRPAYQNRLKIFSYSSNLWAVLKCAHVFVSVSNFEGTPNTVLEAVASQCPVVLSDIPPHREFLSNDAAYFVSPNLPSDIAEGICCALSNKEAAKQKSRQAYSEISRWSLDSISKEYVDLYRQLVYGARLLND